MPKLQVKVQIDENQHWYCISIPEDLLDPEDLGVFKRYMNDEAKESDIMSALIGVVMKLNPLPGVNELSEMDEEGTK